MPIPRPDDPLPQGEAKVAAVQEMFDTIAPRYDLVNRVMTFRMDVGWRRTTVASLGLAKGATVADLASGPGDLRAYFGSVVPLVGGLLSNPAAYRYLPRSVAYLPPPEDMLALLRAAGFADVDRRLLSSGITQLVTATRG